MFELFKRSKNTDNNVDKKTKKRAFMGARNTGMNNFNVSYTKINAEIRTDGIALIQRARALYKNNAVVRSYIDLLIRSILGNQGFILNVTAYNDNGLSDTIANDTIEKFWQEYTKSTKKYVSADHQMNGLDLDKHIIFNYLIDGEVFIKKVVDPKSKFGIRFQVIDALDVDMLYNANVANAQSPIRICMGIKVDEHMKPLSYFIRKNPSLDYYQQGERIEVPADEIIHIYDKKFASQVRGFPILSSVMLELNSLNEYQRAEINASLLNALYMGIFQKTSPDANSYDEYDEKQIDDNGDVATTLQSNVFRYAPDGYTLKNIQSNHPNSNVKEFAKSILKQIAGALGLSYNKIASDYESTSYSSLRQANIQDAVTVKSYQQFFIDNWKDVQYEQFLKYLLLSDLTNLPYQKISKFLEHDFQGRNFEYLSPKDQMTAIQLRLQLGLSNPIMEIHNQGIDPIDVLNGWEKWNQMLKDRGLKMAETNAMIEQSIQQKIEEEI